MSSFNIPLSKVSIHTLLFFLAVALGALFGSLCNILLDSQRDKIFDVGWDLLKVLTTFVAFLFGIKLFELFQITGDQRKIRDQQEKTTDELEAIREVTVELANASTEISIAREERRQGNMHAAMPILKRVDDSLVKIRKKYQQFADLKEAIDREIFAALDLHANCLFDRVIDLRGKELSSTTELESLDKVATRLLGIDENAWRANHWMGVALLLALNEKQGPEEIKSICRRAEPFLSKSVKEQREGNRDILNLCECYIARHQFQMVRNEAPSFTVAMQKPMQKGELLALFFWTIGEYVLTGSDQVLGNFTAIFALAKRHMEPDHFFSGNVVNAVFTHIRNEKTDVEQLNSDERRNKLLDFVKNFCAWAES